MVAPIFASFGLVFNAFGVLFRKPSVNISEVYQITENITSTDGKHSAFEWWNRAENYLIPARGWDISQLATNEWEEFVLQSIHDMQVTSPYKS